MYLTFSGPFSATGNGRWQHLATAPEGTKAGIYFWAVELAHSYRVAYLGKTERSFSLRIAEEVGRFRDGLDGYFDVERFRKGIRVKIDRPEDGAQRLLEELIQCSPIFVAETSWRRTPLLQLESGLIRAVRDFSPETRGFIAHGSSLVHSRPAEPVTIELPPGVLVEGLAGTIS